MSIPPWVWIPPIAIALLLYAFLRWLKWRQDKKWGKMKTVADWKRDIKRTAPFLLALFFTGCGSIKVYYPDGKPLASISTNAKNVAVTSGAMTFTAESVTPSEVVAAEGKALTPLVMTMGTVAGINATTQTVKAVRAPLLPR